MNSLVISRLWRNQTLLKLTAVFLLVAIVSGASAQKKDRTPPTMESINRLSPVSQSTNASSVTFRATFSERVTGFDRTDIVATLTSGSTTTALSATTVSPAGGSGITYDIIVASIPNEGTLKVNLNSSNTGIIDQADNPISGGFTAGQTYIIERTAPVIVGINRQVPTSQNTNGSVVTFRTTFSEPVSGVDMSDFAAVSISGLLTATISGVTTVGTGGNIYDITVSSIAGNGVLRVDLPTSNGSIKDAAGNTLTAGYSYNSGQTYVIDQAAPSVTSINRQVPITQATSSTSVTYRVSFSEPVSGVQASHFNPVTVSGNVSGTVSSVVTVGANGDMYDVVVNQMTGAGDLRLDLPLPATGINDGVGNALSAGFSNGQIFTVSAADNTAPVVNSINRQVPTVQNTNESIATFRVTFSEVVTGVDITDFAAVIVNGSLTATISGVATVGSGGNIYDITVSSIAGNGVLRVDLPTSNGSIKDAAGNALTAGYSYNSGQTYVIDQSAPSVTSINRQVPLTQATSSTSVTYRVSFSEPVSGVQASHFNPVTVSGNVSGTVSSVVAVGANGDMYDVVVSPITGAGDLRLDLPLPASGIKDGAGNAISAGFSSGQIYTISAADNTAPLILGINRQAPTSQNTNVSVATFRVTFSEVVTGVDITDFAAIIVSGSLTATISGVATVGTGGDTYDITVSSITGNGILRVDLPTSNGSIKDAAGNALTAGYSYNSGQTYVIDQAAPSVTSINRQVPLTQATSSTSVTFRVSFSEPVSGVQASHFNPVTVSGNVSGTVSSVVTVGANGDMYDVVVNQITGVGDLRLDLPLPGSGIKDGAGNALSAGFSSGQIYTISAADNTAPVVSSINRQVPAAATTNSSSLIYRITFSEPITGLQISDFTIVSVSGSVSGTVNSITVVGTVGDIYDITVGAVSGNGNVRLDLKSSGTAIADLAGNAITTGFSNGQLYLVDQVSPVTTSVNRQSPLTQNTSASTLVYRVTFSEPVNGVNTSGFTVVTVSGIVTATISSVTAVGSTGNIYDITLTQVTGTGTIRLDVKSSGTGITDAAGNGLSGGFNQGQTYNVSPATAVGFNSKVSITALPVTANTGEKPQAKVWAYDGRHWCVLSNSTGTYLWRLDGTAWTSVLKLSSRSTSRADARLVGNIGHILLYQGAASQMVSVEYVPASTTYKLWSKRTSTVGLNLDTGVETATIDIDGNGRMWLASAGVSDVNVRWSDAPYSNWSAPITIATGIKDDDICAIAYLPNAAQISVFWSNQNTKLFGFKTHADGADPATWSADELPASQSALNVGAGMADDHMNLKVASNGTLYCGVKTSYDLAGYPKISLLIRRPGGTWDNLYEVSQSGTRPVVLLNESLNKIRIVYSSAEFGGDILYKESSLSAISFSPVITLITGGSYDNSTSTHQNLNSEIVILASDNTQAVGVLASDNVPPVLPGTPSLVSPANGVTITTTSPSLTWNSAANTSSYEVQVSVASDFSNIIYDQGLVATTSAPIPGLSLGTPYYWRVKAINHVGSSNWSNVFNFTIQSAASGSLVGNWKMDEGSGNTLNDASAYANNATLSGTSTWVTGASGQAVSFNGSSNYATVPHNVSLNITNAITIAAWIKPELLGTQYIIKKAILGSTNGYELSLSNAGKVFFRINQATSGDTYRVNSSTSYPTDGNTWMHVAATYDGSVMRIYINGVENISKTISGNISINTNTLALTIAAQGDGTSKFKGSIDEGRLYNTALSASEINTLATIAAPLASKSVLRSGPIADPVTMATASNIEADMLLYPNPATSSSSLKFNLEEPGDYTITLRSIDGSNMGVLDRGRASKPQQKTLRIDCSKLARGIYTITLSTRQMNKSLKLFVE